MIGNLNGSGLEHLGSILHKRMHDPDWEVRDSILELIILIITLSYTKFPILQTELMKQNISSTILSMTKNDIECYVRATALKALRETFRVTKIWMNLTSSTDLLEYMTVLMANEQEAIVRREAVVTLIAVYMHQKNTNKILLDKVLPTMIYCAAIDLHWEVRLNALKFWNTLLEQCFVKQGMTEGVFPRQVFSSELRKIVTLTPKEIDLRIGRALEEFASKGGLGVLLANLEETADLEVIRTTLVIIKELESKLKTYNYNPIATNKNKPIDDQEVSKMDINIESQNINGIPSNEAEKLIISDEILDSVVDANDINLLTSAHENALNAMQVDQKYDEKICEPFFHITSEIFLQNIHQKDLESLLNSKVTWNEYTSDSFESLLDDVLYSFGAISDINGMDCY